MVVEKNGTRRRRRVAENRGISGKMEGTYCKERGYRERNLLRRKGSC
jgi:hypothetical protein